MNRLLPLLPPVVSSLFYPARASRRVGIAPFIRVAILALIRWGSGFIVDVARRRPGLVNGRDALRPNGVRATVDIVMPLRFGIPQIPFGAGLNVHCDGRGDQRVGRDGSGACRCADRKVKLCLPAANAPQAGSSRLAVMQPLCCEGGAIEGGAAPDQPY
jgi:hypothetical protein